MEQDSFRRWPRQSTPFAAHAITLGVYLALVLFLLWGLVGFFAAP